MDYKESNKKLSREKTWKTSALTILNKEQTKEIKAEEVLQENFNNMYSWKPGSTVLQKRALEEKKKEWEFKIKAFQESKKTVPYLIKNCISSEHIINFLKYIEKDSIPYLYSNSFRRNTTTEDVSLAFVSLILGSNFKPVSYIEFSKMLNFPEYSLSDFHLAIEGVTDSIFKDLNCAVNLEVLFFDPSCNEKLPSQYFYKKIRERMPVHTFTSMKQRREFALKERERIYSEETEYNIIKTLSSLIWSDQGRETFYKLLEAS